MIRLRQQRNVAHLLICLKQSMKSTVQLGILMSDNEDSVGGKRYRKARFECRLSLTKSLILSILLDLSEPQFPDLFNRVRSTNLVGL